MGNYGALKEAAEKNKKVTKVNPTYVEFKKSGVSVLGRYIGTSEIEGKKGKNYMQYIFDTDSGPVKFHCGSVFDGEVMPLMIEGCVYEITFLGQEDIKGGNRVNKFEVIYIDEIVVDNEEEEPEPPEETKKGKK